MDYNFFVCDYVHCYRIFFNDLKTSRLLVVRGFNFILKKK